MFKFKVPYVKVRQLLFNLIRTVMKELLIILSIFLSALCVQAQGVGFGTATPTEILHLYRDQNVIAGDVAIRHQTQAAGTGPITFGNVSGVSSNLAGIGSVAWSSPTAADASDDSYTTATYGTSNYLYSDIDFTIPVGATINSITVDVEKSYTNNPVTALDAWAGESTGTNYTTYTSNYAISAGTDRMLVVCVFQNNDDNDNETINNFVTYGGQDMVRQGVVQNSNNEDLTLEIWTLNEAGIAAAGSTELSLTWSGRVDDAQFYYAGSYQYVDQTTPVSASDINTANDVNSLQLASALTVAKGDMVISTAGFGNNNDRVLTQPSGYTVQVAEQFSSGPDGTFNVSDKAITASGTEQPTTAYSGGVEDMAVGAIVLNNNFGSTTDNVVSLYSGGALIGADLSSGTDWTTTDAYTSYSGTATEAQINAADFGLVISSVVGGSFCTAQIDHVRMTIVYTVTPAVLTEFTTGIDLSTGNYVISEASSLGTNDIVSMSSSGVTFSGPLSATTLTAISVTQTSDKRYKKNIVPLTGSLGKLSQVEGVSYDMRRVKFPEMGFSKEKQIGFIAQDLEKIYPELVRTDKGGFKSVAYSSMTPILVEAIKELNLKIESLEGTANTLTEKNNQLKSEVSKMDTLEKDIVLLKNAIKAIQLDLNMKNISDR